MIMEGSRRSKPHRPTFCCPELLRRAISAASANVKFMPGEGVQVEVFLGPPGSCPQNIHPRRMGGLLRKKGCTDFPPRAWKHLQKRRCATTAVLDVDLGAAPPIKDVDWLVVEEASAEHGDVAPTTTPTPTTRTAVTSTRHHSIELFLARGVGGVNQSSLVG